MDIKLDDMRGPVDEGEGEGEGEATGEGCPDGIRHHLQAFRHG
jgi:hypothetical protein